MTAFHRDWFNEIDTIQREMGRLLDHYACSKPPMVQFAKRAWEPAVDVYETDQYVIVAVDLAGVREEDIQVVGDGSALIIRGGRYNPGAGTRRTYYQMEINSGPFERLVPLPVSADIQQAKAQYTAGILEVTLPKTPRRTPSKAYIQIVRGRRVTDGI